MKYRLACRVSELDTSHPARGAWIEIEHRRVGIRRHLVAPRKGCVD